MSAKSVQRGFNRWTSKSCPFLIAALILLPAPLTSSQAYGSVTPTPQHSVWASAKQSQADERPLEPSQPIERDMEGGAVHAYSITVLRGQYLHVVAEQLGIDLILSLIGPDGKPLSEIDRWSRTQGPESISLIAVESGKHRLLLRSLDKDATAGKYKLWLEELRDAKPQDIARIDAEHAYDSGDKLNSQGTPKSKRTALEKLGRALELWKSLGDKLWEAIKVQDHY